MKAKSWQMKREAGPVVVETKGDSGKCKNCWLIFKRLTYEGRFGLVLCSPRREKFGVSQTPAWVQTYASE